MGFMVAGSFSYAEAQGNYTLTAECDLTTGNIDYVSNGPAVNRYYDVYQGIVGYGELMNGTFAGNTDTYQHTSTCDDLDDSLTPTKLHIGSYWFATVVPATDVSAFRDYFTGVSPTPPNNNYGISLCTNFSCVNLIVTSLGTTSAALGYLQTVSSTTTINQISEQCAESGNVFSRGICVSFAFLFVPSPETLNDFASLASTSAEKFPISWFYGVRDVFSAVSASSSTMADVSFSLHDLGIGSTTGIGNVLPDIEVFSTSTITHFMPDGVWTAIQGLMAAVLWIGLATHIWFRSQNLFHV